MNKGQLTIWHAIGLEKQILFYQLMVKELTFNT